jgi:hypothetical protein
VLKRRKLKRGNPAHGSIEKSVDTVRMVLSWEKLWKADKPREGSVVPREPPDRVGGE